jgi:hypothetical protein
MRTPETGFSPEGRINVTVKESERASIARLASSLAGSEPGLAGNHYGGTVGTGCHGPRILIEDRSEIGMAGPGGAGLWSYRMRMLAGDGDCVVVAGEKYDDFESYTSSRLGLGRPQIINVVDDDGKAPLSPAARCMADDRTLDQLVTWVRERGEATIVPFIGSEIIWKLADRLASEAGAPISVAAPAPYLTGRANDKLWFAERIGELFGRDALPPTDMATDRKALSRKAAKMAGEYRQIVVKVLDSAGSYGNIRINCSLLRCPTPLEVEERVFSTLEERGWNGEFPLLLSAWEKNVLENPSVQMWIPEAGQDPIIEGVFVQSLTGDNGRFAGASSSDLPGDWNQRISEGAMRIGLLFQYLGYFGRCSVDALLVGADFDEASLRWIECNGRWGGVSIPLSTALRLGGGGPELAVVQTSDFSHRAMTTDEATGILNGLLHTGNPDDEGVVLLSPAVLLRGEGIHLMALSGSPASARSIAEEASKRIGQAA